MKRIPLSGKAGAGLFALVDDEDYPLLSRLTWNLGAGGVPINKTAKYMHKLVMGYPNWPKVIDHADRNVLNNQKSNLRLATSQKNRFNSKGLSTGRGVNGRTSIYKGVVKVTTSTLRKPWRAQISKTIDGVERSFYLGMFATEKEAALVYDTRARELYGAFAYLNLPDSI